MGSEALAKSNTNRNPKRHPVSRSKRQTESSRGWGVSVAFAALAVVAVLTLAIVANLAIGRIIHWNIVSVFGIVGFVFLAIGRKYRTI